MGRVESRNQPAPAPRRDDHAWHPGGLGPRRTDQAGANQAGKEAIKQIKSLAGMDVEIWAAQSIAKAFDKLSIPYPSTEKGAPSFTKSFLSEHNHDLAKWIVKARNLNKTSGSFIDGI